MHLVPSTLPIAFLLIKVLYILYMGRKISAKIKFMSIGECDITLFRLVVHLLQGPKTLEMHCQVVGSVGGGSVQ